MDAVLAIARKPLWPVLGYIANRILLTVTCTDPGPCHNGDVTIVAAANSESRSWSPDLLAISVAILPAALALANGGYFPSSWGWALLGFAWLTAIALMGRDSISIRGLSMSLPLLLFAVWMALSSAWGATTTDAFAAAERELLIVVGVAAALVVIRGERARQAFPAVVVGVTLVCAYALATRLFPNRLSSSDPLSGYRLSAPIGYWNSLGIYAAIGLVVATGLLARAKRAGRVLAAVAIPILALTQYFTYSRGALIALAIGLVATFALDGERVQWLAAVSLATTLAGIVVFLASQMPALTTQNLAVSRAANEGHIVAAALFGACVLSAAAAYRWSPAVRSGRLRGLVSATVSCLIAVAVVASVVALGGPSGIETKFSAPPPSIHGRLNQRFFTFSGSYRAPLWHIAWREYTSHPILGGGAGSYERYYLEHRTRSDKVKNVHNLYLETLAETGPIGLSLLLAALLAPVYFGFKKRRIPLVPALTGAVVALLVHMAVDWDWQVTAVALTGLFCGAGVVAAQASESAAATGMSLRVRNAMLSLTILVIAIALVILVGNMSLAQASSAADKGNWSASARDARRAHTWAPWSSEPYRLLGEAQLGDGDTKSAVASFGRAIAKSPDDWNLWFDLARATTGRAQTAALDHAARLNPLSPEIAELRKEIAAQGVIDVVKK